MCAGRRMVQQAKKCRPLSLGITLRANLHAHMCFPAIFSVEEKIVVAQEPRTWLPIEDALFKARSDWERGRFAVDQLITADHAERKFDLAQLFNVHRVSAIAVVGDRRRPYRFFRRSLRASAAVEHVEIPASDSVATARIVEHIPRNCVDALG